MVSDKKIHRAFRTRTALFKQNQLDKFFIFTIYQNNTLALRWGSILQTFQNSGNTA